MGNRRLGRKRLFAVNKLGQTNANAAGPGIADAVVTNTVRREGHKIITEITVDLGTSKATIASKNTLHDVIGVAGTDGAYLTQLTPAVNGYISYAEMVCLEVPTAATNACTDIDLRLSSASDGAYDDDSSGLGGTVLLIEAGGAWAVGEVDHYAVTHGTAHDTGADNLYAYLAVGAAPGGDDTFTGGKFVLTFEGYAEPDDI
tara:strand:- start:169 stop:774 length:606 start_codon:yes stop_codon:yes gene_type:complete